MSGFILSFFLLYVESDPVTTDAASAPKIWALGWKFKLPCGVILRLSPLALVRERMRTGPLADIGNGVSSYSVP